MHPQLQEIIEDFERAQLRMHALAGRVPDEQWNVRKNPKRWSVAENVEHLNMFSEVYIPLLTGHLEEARVLRNSGTVRAAGAGRRYHRGLLGGMLWRMMPPPVRLMRTKAIPAFLPAAALPPDQIRRRFDDLQGTLVRLTEAADGLPIDRVFMESPVQPGMRYNLFAALGILPRHQHRHLWQAENSL